MSRSSNVDEARVQHVMRSVHGTDVEDWRRETRAGASQGGSSMSILNAILGAQDGQTVGALSQQFGLSQDQTVSALGALLPALAGGLQRNVSNQGGLEQLMSALTTGQHGRYIDDVGRLAIGRHGERRKRDPGPHPRLARREPRRGRPTPRRPPALVRTC